MHKAANTGVKTDFAQQCLGAKEKAAGDKKQGQTYKYPPHPKIKIQLRKKMVQRRNEK